MTNAALDAARRAQERVWELRTSGTSPNSPEARAAVNHLMSRLRGLPPEALDQFQKWKAASSPFSSDE